MIDDKTLERLEQIPKDINYDSSREFGDQFTEHSDDRKIILKLVAEIRRLKAVLRQIGSAENGNPVHVSKIAREAVDKEESGD